VPHRLHGSAHVCELPPARMIGLDPTRVLAEKYIPLACTPEPRSISSSGAVDECEPCSASHGCAAIWEAPRHKTLQRCRGAASKVGPRGRTDLLPRRAVTIGARATLCRSMIRRAPSGTPPAGDESSARRPVTSAEGPTRRPDWRTRQAVDTSVSSCRLVVNCFGARGGPIG